jgi:excisionase family DNA binding protein
MDTQDASFPRLAYSISEVTVLSGLSASSVYRLIAAKKLRVVKVGRRTLVPSDELIALTQPKDQEAVHLTA